MNQTYDNFFKYFFQTPTTFVSCTIFSTNSFLPFKVLLLRDTVCYYYVSNNTEIFVVMS